MARCVFLHPLLLLLLVDNSGCFDRHVQLETMMLLGCFMLFGNKVDATIKLVAWIVQVALLDMVT